MRILLLTLSLISSTSLALDREMLPRACKIERLEQALVACIEHEAAQLRDRMAARIVGSTADLQAATQPELAAFERGLADVQARWADTTDAECDARHARVPVDAALCRLRAAELRQDQLDASLADLRYRLGANPLAPLPALDDVEILVPLELPDDVGGPEVDARVPFFVPVAPR